MGHVETKRKRHHKKKNTINLEEMNLKILVKEY